MLDVKQFTVNQRHWVILGISQYVLSVKNIPFRAYVSSVWLATPKLKRSSSI